MENEDQDITSQNKKSENKPARDARGRLLPGNTSNPNGRPVGSLSITTRIRQMLNEDPKLYQSLCDFYVKDDKMRDLLWRMLDGQPQQKINQVTENTHIIVDDL